jgi:prephenate dehydrogenase
LDRITVITAGPMGVSIGLGLRAAGLRDTEIVGSSGDRDLLASATRMGAFDETSGNLRAAIRGAGMVVLDMPLGDTKELMEAIGPILERDCVVTDTGTNKVEVLGWAKSYLGPDKSFVGGRPLPRERLDDVRHARASVFNGSSYCVIPAEDAAPEAVKTVVGMVELLGARPLFLDAAEHDSYCAATTHLPRILSSALMGAVSTSAAWREIALVAGAEFERASSLAADDPVEGAGGCLASPDAVARWIDRAIEELSSYRDHVTRGDGGLLDAFTRAHVELSKWEAGSVVEETRPEGPSVKQTIGSMFLGGRLTRRLGQISDARKSPDGNSRRQS